MSFYVFKREDAEEFARMQGIRTFTKGEELQFQSCPYCHGGSGNDKRTFSINLRNGAFNCKRSSCSVHGNMITLSRDFGFSLGRDVDAYYQTKAYADKQFRRFKEKHKIDSRPEAIKYLESRKIPEEIAKKYEITCKEDGKTLVFPFRDENGELQMFKYRNTAFKKGDKGSKEWCESNCKPILFGMNQCSGNGTLVMTEGQMDSLSCSAAGIPNAVSVPFGMNGFTFIPYCYDFLKRFQQIVIFGDNENGHITLSEEMTARFPRNTKVVQPEDYQNCKDANDLLQLHGPEALRKAVENAKPLSSNGIKKVADIKPKDIDAIPGMCTGFPSLDGILGGKLRIGQLGILTGKRGDGKSTLASMIAVHAVSQGFKTFFYSGELADYHFRNWMDRQVSGRKIALTDGMAADLKAKLDAFYGDKAYIFDNTFLEDTEDDEQTALLNAMEIAILQLGCQFLVVDNLMSALTAGPSVDIYRAQSEFVGKLVKMAKLYGVIILLVAHPRKSNGILSNDDISGSGDITNKADIVLSYGKADENTPSDERILRVLKNRLNGRVTGKDGIKLVFDARPETDSKRIAEHTSDFLKLKFLPEILTEKEEEELPFDADEEKEEQTE